MAYTAVNDAKREPPPESAARKGKGIMPKADIQSVITVALSDAIEYVDLELSPERAKATNYYNGKPFGNEEEGRSQAVLTEVRDAILGVLPALLRVLHGPEHVVEFAPRQGKDAAFAEQATDYARYLYEEKNAGFMTTLSILKDGLIKKLGIVKWGRSEADEQVTTPYRGVTRDEMRQAVANAGPDAKLNILDDNGDGTYNAEISTTSKSGNIWIKAVPPDDFFWNREARSLDDAILVGHKERRTRGELVAMGIKEKDIDEFAGSGSDSDAATRNNEEEIARRMSAVSGFGTDPNMGPENDKVLYCEAYMHIDVDGDGVAELRKICTIGSTYHVVKNTPIKSRPFAVFTPDPEPHAVLGSSWYDRLKDLQLIDSQLIRGMLDSLSSSLFPRIGYIEGQVSVADILNNAIGAPIRMKMPGALQPLEVPFAGEKVMPIMGFMQDVIQRRTGQHNGALTLDADALQSTAPEAAQASISASQAQQEMLAHIFAEQTMKPMFRGILELIAQEESAPELVRLRGQYVQVDPSAFDPNMQVSVNVALGTTNIEKKISVLMNVVADQTAILTQFGPDNPVVDIAMLRNAKAKILWLQGIKDVEAYYKPIPPGYKPPPPPPPPPNPEFEWMKTEKDMAFQKNMKELAIEADKLKLEEKRLESDTMLAMRKMSLDAIIKKYVADAANGAAKTIAEIDAEVQRDVADAEMTFGAMDTMHGQALDQEKLSHDVDMNTRAADLAESTAATDAAATGAEGA